MDYERKSNLKTNTYNVKILKLNLLEEKLILKIEKWFKLNDDPILKLKL